MQETHSTIKNKNTWVKCFNGRVFFSYGASKSSSVLIAYLGKASFALNKQKADKAGRILILDVRLDVDQYILINLYNANTTTEQFKIFKKLQNLLKFFDINQNKKQVHVISIFSLIQN